MAPIKVDPDKVREFKDAECFYKWLGKHHDKEYELWIKIHKMDSGLRSITPKEAIFSAPAPPVEQCGSDRPGNAHWSVRNNLNPFFLHGPMKLRRWTQRRLRVLFPVPVDIGGDELQPGHSPIRVHVEDDVRWDVAKEVLGVGLRK